MSVKETQGSVEVTSYGQMENIYKHGSYTIGSTRRGVYTSQSQVICLDLSNPEKSLPKTSYSLDDLCDLESKLVLITSREDSKVEVFQQVSVQCVHMHVRMFFFDVFMCDKKYISLKLFFIVHTTRA